MWNYISEDLRLFLESNLTPLKIGFPSQAYMSKKWNTRNLKTQKESKRNEEKFRTY